MVADVYAKMALWRHINSNSEVFQMKQVSNAIPSTQTKYSGKSVTIASSLRKRLKHHIAQEQILKYWKDHGKEQVGHEDFDKEVFTHTGRNIPMHHQIWIPK